MIYTNVCRLGNDIGFRGYDDQQRRIQRRVEFLPTLFVHTQNDSQYQDIHGNKLESIQPGSFWECKNFIEKWNGIENFSVYGQDNWISQFLSELYMGSNFSAPSLDDLKVAYIDIETECENGFPDIENPVEKINAITMRIKNKTYVFGLSEKWKIDTELRDYECFSHVSEEKMLKQFIEVWRHVDPDIVTGWNCNLFDIPYIIERIIRLMGQSEANRLSPWEKLYKRQKRDDYQNIRTAYTIYGVSILDYMELYKKYVMTPRESYKLDFIASVEINHKKLDWKKYYSTMSEFYKKDFQMFIEYNIIDVDLIFKLEEKLNLIKLQTNIAYTALINYEDVFSPVRTWDAIIYNHLIEKNIVVPFKENAEKSTQYAGAFVKDPKPGLYDWVVSFDLASLYPSLIMQYNISPDTIITREDLYYVQKNTNDEQMNQAANTLLEKMSGDNITVSVEGILNNGVDENIQSSLKTLNLGLAANGYMFTNNKEGFLPYLMNEMFEMRKAMKKNMINSKKELELIKTELHKRGIEDE